MPLLRRSLKVEAIHIINNEEERKSPGNIILDPMPCLKQRLTAFWTFWEDNP